MSAHTLWQAYQVIHILAHKTISSKKKGDTSISTIIILIGGILMFAIAAAIAFGFLGSVVTALMMPLTIIQKLIMLVKGWMT